MSVKCALLFGSTGLIGGKVLAQLLADDSFSHVIIAGRRLPKISHPKLEKRVIEMDSLDQAPALFDVDVVFCCLGTTLRQAGSREAFRRVDYDFCVAIATAAAAAGVKRLLIVSAVNANAKSAAFYAQVKGQMEQAVSALSIPSLVFMQPSLLEDERDERRFGEEFGQVAMKLIKPLMGWSRADWLSISAQQVADAMVLAACAPEQVGVQRLRYRQIVQLAEQYQQQRG